MINFTITNTHRATATVLMIVNAFGHQYRKSIGVGVPPSMWNAKKHRARITADYDGGPVNDAILRWTDLANRTVRHFEDEGIIPTASAFSEYLEGIVSRPKEQILFTDYMEQYILRYQSNRTGHTVTGWRSMLGKIRSYEASTGARITFQDIGMPFYSRFQTWFYSLGYGDNYFGSIIKFIKQCYTEARVVDRLHEGTAIEHHDFITVRRTADAVALDEAELAAIESCDLSPDRLMAENPSMTTVRARDKSSALNLCRSIFLIGAYTGLRVSDFKRLSTAHISDKYISIKTHKTGADVVIPIHPVIRRILDGGFDLTRRMSDQKMNGHIKEICRLAGITKRIIVHESVNGQMVEIVKDKCALISNHTARRSFATNAIKAGIPTLSVMKILGHTQEATTLKYIKISEIENAELLSLHPFFNDDGK